MTGLRGVDAVRADERREDAAFQELRAQIDQTAAERAAQLRDHGVIILLPAVQMVRIAQPVQNIFRAQASGDKGEIPLLLQRRQARHGHTGPGALRLADGGAVLVDELLRRRVRQMLAVRILRDGLPVVIAVVAAEAEQHRRIAVTGPELPVKLLQSRVDGRAHFCVVFHGDALRTQRVEIMLLTQVIALAVISDALDDGVAEDLQIFHGDPSCLFVSPV